MKLTVRKQDFLEKLMRTQYVHEKKSTLDITGCVLLTTREKEIEIIATDLETNFRDYCPADILIDGSIAVNSKKLLEVVRGIIGNNVTLEMTPEENILVVEGGKSVFRLPTRSPEDFPYTPFFDDHELIQMEAPEFKTMIDKVLFSVPTRRTRSNIAGLVIKENVQPGETEEGTRIVSLELFSIDIHRMVRIVRDFEMPQPLDISDGIVVPKRSAQELSNILQDAEMFHIGVSDNSLVVRKGSCSLTIRLLNFEVPQLNMSPLKNTPYNIQVDREHLLEVVKRIAVMTSEDYRHVTVTVSNSFISLSINNPGVGAADEDLEVVYSGPTMNFTFNVRYMIEAISNLESETINIGIIKEDGPFIFTGENDKGYISLLMPLVLISESEEEIPEE